MRQIIRCLFPHLFILLLIIPTSSYSEEGCSHISAVNITNNCACNALASAFGLLDIEITEEEITKLTPADKDGLTSMYTLLQAAKQKGLQAKALKLTYEQLIKVDMPAVVHLNTQHFITLKEVKDDGIISIENNKETFILKDEFLNNYSGYTLTFNQKTKGIALSNTKLKGIKGSHCTCGGCTSSDCNTGSCGGGKDCSQCGGTCPGGGICLFCPDKSSPVCGGQAQPCGCLGSTNCATSICPEYCDSLLSCPAANCEKIDCNSQINGCKVIHGNDPHYSNCSGASTGGYTCGPFCKRDASEPDCDWGTWCCGGCGRTGVTLTGCPANYPGQSGCENESTNPPGHCRSGSGSCGIQSNVCTCTVGGGTSCNGAGNCQTCSYHPTNCSDTSNTCRGSGSHTPCHDNCNWSDPNDCRCGVPQDCGRTTCGTT